MQKQKALTSDSVFAVQAQLMALITTSDLPEEFQHSWWMSRLALIWGGGILSDGPSSGYITLRSSTSSYICFSIDTRRPKKI